MNNRGGALSYFIKLDQINKMTKTAHWNIRLSDEVDFIVKYDMHDNYVKKKSKYLVPNGFDERPLRMFMQELMK